MSMIGNFRAVRDDDIGAMLERPARVVRLLYDEAPVESGGLLGRLMGRSGSSPEEDEWRPTAAGEELDVDKAWHGIHFLLTGTAWAGDPPLDFIVQGGREIGNIDVGYGPARAFSSSDVRDLAEAVAPIEPEVLRDRFDPEQMMAQGVYPEIWDRDPADDDTLGYLLEYFGDLRAFVRRRAERGEGMLIYVN
jgi:hypothetical protein